MHWSVLATAWYSDAASWLRDALSIEVTTTMLLLVSTAASILAAYTAIQALRLEGRSREADTQLRRQETSVELILRLDEKFSSDPDFVARRREAGQCLLTGDYSLGLQEVLNFLEWVSYFVRNDIISVEMAKNSFGGIVGKYWVVSREFVFKERRIENRPNLWSDTEYLFNRFQDIDENSSGVRWAEVLSDEARSAFINGEANVKA